MSLAPHTSQDSRLVAMLRSAWNGFRMGQCSQLPALLDQMLDFYLLGDLTDYLLQGNKDDQRKLGLDRETEAMIRKNLSQSKLRGEISSTMAHIIIPFFFSLLPAFMQEYGHEYKSDVSQMKQFLRTNRESLKQALLRNKDLFYEIQETARSRREFLLPVVTFALSVGIGSAMSNREGNNLHAEFVNNFMNDILEGVELTLEQEDLIRSRANHYLSEYTFYDRYYAGMIGSLMGGFGGSRSMHSADELALLREALHKS